ncbi:MAG: peptidase M64 [Chlorobiota bacterium]|nr:MAG: peptidase M64 [Chlorobiota bacterium]
MQVLRSLLFLFLVINLNAQTEFEKYFEKKTLRLDYTHAGNKTDDFYYFSTLIEEPHWGGPVKNLIDPFNYGKYKAEVYDAVTGKLIYSKHYSTLFSEWQTTDEAKTVNKAFEESVVFPFPKAPVKVTISTRLKDQSFVKKFEMTIDPKNYFIKKDRDNVYPSFKVVNNGDPGEKVDIVIIPEGYTSKEMDQFKKDCSRFAQYLFNSSPYKENKTSFNIWRIEAPSRQSGTDIPAEKIYVNTAAGTSFYTFDEERYLMTEEYNAVRDLAANAPYDQIYILVNTDKYGGGAIYNYYATCVNFNIYSEYVFVHEFGHAFAFLADEYYTSSTAYNDFYPLGVEPLEANITTLVNFESKWKDLVKEDTPIPTPATKEFEKRLGAFEGGGYVAKGVYRPKQDCSMNSISVDNYCTVCKRAIQRMIDYYTGK